MKARPLLRSAIAWMSACGSDPEPLLRATVTYDHATPGDTLIVEVLRTTDDAVVARRVLPAGSAFPVEVELGQGDLVPGGPPAAGPLVARARLDTLAASEAPIAREPLVPGQPVTLALQVPIPPPARPTYANTKGSRYDIGLITGVVAYGGAPDGRALILEVVAVDGSLVERVASADATFPHPVALRSAPPPSARLRAWLDADGDPATRQPPEPSGEIEFDGESGFTLTLRDAP